MKNFKVTAKEDGKEYWISRSVAVVGVVVGIENGMIKKFLVSKRGPGCPDFIGSWSCTCGYLDFDETAEEGVKRELWEELGLDLKDYRAILWEVATDPKENTRQNVILRYIIPIPMSTLNSLMLDTISLDTESRGGEKDEVSDVKLIDVTNLSDYPWAFSHDKVILKAYSDWKLFKIGKL